MVPTRQALDRRLNIFTDLSGSAEATLRGIIDESHCSDHLARTARGPVRSGKSPVRKVYLDHASCVADASW